MKNADDQSRTSDVVATKFAICCSLEGVEESGIEVEIIFILPTCIEKHKYIRHE